MRKYAYLAELGSGHASYFFSASLRHVVFPMRQAYRGFFLPILMRVSLYLFSNVLKKTSPFFSVQLLKLFEVRMAVAREVNKGSAHLCKTKIKIIRISFQIIIP